MKRFASIIFWTVDDCCTVRKFLQGIFGDDLKVLLDIFHFMDRLAGALEGGVAHPAHQQFMAELRQAVFVCNTKDKNEV
jgi:hypothetical protein